MARPIRGQAAQIAAPGDAARSQGRYSTGLEWVQRGNADLSAGVGALADTVRQYASKLNDLEDATAASEAMSALRVRTAERVQQLDPTAQDYMDQVAGAAQETLDSVVQSTTFRNDLARRQFLANAESVVGGAQIDAIGKRERAVTDRAVFQAEEARNAAVAGIAMGKPRELALLEAQASIGGILAQTNPTVRDRVARGLASDTAEAEVRFRLQSKDFAGATNLLRQYGGEGLLAPPVVRAIRAGMETAQREAQAAGERRIAEEAGDVIDVLRGGDTDKARDMLADARRAGRLGSDTRAGRRIDAAMATAERAAQRAGNSEVVAALSTIAVGGAPTPREETLALDAGAREGARRAVDMLGPDATPEQRQQAAAEGAQAGLRAMTLRMVSGGFLPRSVLRQAEALDDGGLPPDQRAAAALDMIATVGQPGTRLFDEAFKRAPITRAAVEWAARRGNVDPATLAERLRALPAPADFRGVNEEVSKYVRDDGGKVLDRSIRDAGVRNLTMADRAAALDMMRADMLAGASGEQAAKTAAQWVRDQRRPSGAATTDVTMRAQESPVQAMSPRAVEAYGADNIEKGYRERAREMRSIVSPGREDDVEVMFRRVMTAGGPAVYAYWWRKGADQSTAEVVRTAPNTPWSIPATDDAIEDYLNLQGMRERAIQRRGVANPFGRTGPTVPPPRPRLGGRVGADGLPTVDPEAP